MERLLQFLSIIISIVMIILIMLQVRGGALGGLLGEGGGGISRTRHGLERTMFRVTIVLAIVFMGISLFSVIFTNNV